MLQVEALEILKTGANCFLTGVPGAGKTYVINKYVEYLEDKGIYPAITASTGIAATHIGGRTIHSFVGLGVVDYLDAEVLDKIMQREKVYKKILNTKVLIIDEISMLDAKVLDKVNVILKGVKKSDKPFGGIQVVFVGDFFQLPPVQKKGEEQKYFAFMGKAWKEARPLTLYLEEQFRQTDEVFTKLLLAIRENNIDEMHVEILEELKRKAHEKLGIKMSQEKKEGEFYEEESVEVLEDSEEKEDEAKGGYSASISSLTEHIIELHSHNKNVDSINDTRLKALKEKEYTYEMLYMGRKNLVETLIKSCLSPQILKLKKGAKVIFTKNDLEGKYVNGTMGEVTELDDFNIKVTTKDGKIIDLKRSEWTIEEEGKVKARIEQFPLRLAWAITVHKSQGMSLDEAIINLGDTFEYGQGYVALSRVRSLDGLYLKSYNPKSLRVNEYISEFDEKIRKDSRFIQEKFLKADSKKLLETQKEFIEKNGGVFSGGVTNPEKTPRKHTTEVTLELIKGDKSLEEIMKERDMVFSTIVSHIEELFKKQKIDKQELQKISPVNIFDIPNKVKKAFKKHMHKKDEEGNIKLSPVWKELEEKIPFEDLRFYRLVLED
jgi:nucleoside-triphosphatase THEP1